MKIKGLYTKREWYYWQPPQKDGTRPKPVALKTKDNIKALQLIKELKDANDLNVAISKGSMKSAIADYITEKKDDGTHTDRTNLKAEGVLSNINEQLKNPTLDAITHKTIIDWKTWKKSQSGHKNKLISDSSVDNYMRILIAFLTWCVETKRLKKNPTKRIKLSKIKKVQQTQFCTTTERDLLLNDPPTDEINFILHFGFYAGLRFGEMLAMEPNWINISPDGKSGVLSVQKTDYWTPKDKELRQIPLHKKLITFIGSYGMRKPFMLAPYRKEWKPEPNYRFNPKKSFKSHVTKTGVSPCTYHTLRHSFATHLAQAGVSMKDIADLLGDDIIVTERHYIAFTPATHGIIGNDWFDKESGEDVYCAGDDSYASVGTTSDAGKMSRSLAATCTTRA